MNVTPVSDSISRAAGGIFEITRRTAQTLAGQPQML